MVGGEITTSGNVWVLRCEDPSSEFNGWFYIPSGVAPDVTDAQIYTSEGSARTAARRLRKNRHFESEQWVAIRCHLKLDL